MYKEQVELLTRENTRLKDDAKKYRNHIQDRDAKLKEKA
jgi:hypothetical protein